MDKTRYLRWLIDRGRTTSWRGLPDSGKSLLLDACAELLRGCRELFRGLAIHDDWDWSVRHPVIRIALEPEEPLRPDALVERLVRNVGEAARESGIAPWKGSLR